jgi:hypothetical protein
MKKFNDVIRWMISLLLICVAISCQQESPTAVVPTPSLGLFPFALGNKWKYVDSVFTASETFVDSFVVSVESTRSESGTTWCKLSHPFNPSIAATEFTIRNDSLFSLQYSESPHGIVTLSSLEYIPPLNTDTAHYQSHFDADVVITKSVARTHDSIFVPAGTFAGCAVYWYDIYPEHYREVLKPTVGILTCDIRADSTHLYGSARRRHIQLISYEVTK